MYPKAELSAKDRASDARIEADNQRRRAREAAQRRRKIKARAQAINTKLASAPDIKLSNQQAWQAYVAANRGSIGAGILNYARRWARLMQLEIAQGKRLADIWEKTSHEADLEGLTSTASSYAVGVLAECWTQGKELDRLYRQQRAR